MANNYLRKSGFDRIVADCRRVDIGNDLWYPAFRTHDEAFGFGLYIAGYFRRVVTNLKTRVSVTRIPWGYVALCAVTYPGLGVENGIIVCSEGDPSNGVGGECEGIVLRNASASVLLPVKQHCYTAVTESGSQYVSFKDGTAFCHGTDGPQHLAVRLLYTKSKTQADAVKQSGGELSVTAEPTLGFYPVYCVQRPLVDGSTFKFGRESFRRGTRVQRVLPAIS